MAHSVRLNRGESKIIPTIAGDDWGITVKADAKYMLVQNTTKLDITSLQENRRLEDQLNREIEQRMREALIAVQKLKADIIGFAEAFHRKYPKQWNKEKDQRKERFPQIKVKYEISSQVISPGKRTLPAGWNEDEVVK
ncbi:Ger(x)C family spore germination C-terminal domain-containing protein [Paenibacillus mendelii]|nr:Ger(x)C family spore germination C-terminal domain-containing protein [Paenibacillus mendelii]MCQ6559579.1 Ger(x)C family spore germination C-terminal domain-containing protein [Paenibacillus mendelii]